MSIFIYMSTFISYWVPFYYYLSGDGFVAPLYVHKIIPLPEELPEQGLL